MCGTRISLGLMIHAGMRLASSRRFIVGGPVTNLEELVCCQVSANETNSEGKCQFSVRNRDVHVNAQCSNRW